ncbi:DEAD/DEAH box helicase, partial [Bifidobacteriaceae bacterium NR003]
MPHTHNAASHKKRGAKNNHEFNARRERNCKAEKAREKARQKALRYEETAIREAEQDFANKENSKKDFAKKGFAKKDFAKKENNKKDFAKNNKSSQNSVIIPDSAIESRENYRDDVTFTQLGVPDPLVEVLRADGKTTAF